MKSEHQTVELFRFFLRSPVGVAYTMLGIFSAPALGCYFSGDKVSAIELNLFIIKFPYIGAAAIVWLAACTIILVDFYYFSIGRRGVREVFDQEIANAKARIEKEQSKNSD